MYTIEFYKDEENYKIFVFDWNELMQVLNYIHEYEYELGSIHEDYMFVGLESFKDFLKDEEKGEEK